MKTEWIPFESAAGRKKRRMTAAILAVAVMLLTGTCVYAESSFRALSGDVVRLHVLANSDSEADQALKLKVRDRILQETDRILADCPDQDTAECRIRENLEYLCACAAECVGTEGYTYPVTARMEQSYFPTRYYEGGALPAGTYTALRIEIGNAAGHNWWCVLFPQLCMVHAAVPEEETGQENPVILETREATLHFKFLDFFQKTRHEVSSLWTRILH